MPEAAKIKKAAEGMDGEYCLITNKHKMMQFRVFQIPSASPGQADELNAWLRSHRILRVTGTGT